MGGEMTEKSTLEWYAVKLIFEFIITGDPNPEKIDKEYSTDKTYEESIMLIKASSFDHAYSITELKAKESEYDLINPYDETVNYKFAEAIDCFQLFDEELETGTELYSRFLTVSKDITRDEFIDQYYPDTIKED
ncbi:DUF4288 domain-containing protein [Neobacillus drentensis]|uniref:DUF4288 domain-containing protein n=1 Tax=Neobacillus drentensis TaxID=220684 RepID=UPI00300241B8